MGKSNRIRTQRAERVVSAPQVTKEKKGAPSWLYPLIAIVVMVGVILGVAATFISSSGIIFRMQKGIKSENYSMSGTVLQYMFMEQYSNFVSNNQNYLSLYGLDTAHDLKEQKYTLDDSGENTIDTWYDYFMAETIEQANEILIYCEEADKRGIKLEDSDYTSIDSSFQQMELMVQLYNMYGYNYTLDSYIASMYGSGIKEKDIRNYLKLYTLATKCAGVVGEELMNAITPDRINAEYEANKNNYHVVDYDVFTVSVSYSAIQKELYPNVTELNDEQKAAVLAEYEKRVLEAAQTKKLYAATLDVVEFETMLLQDTANKEFDASYTSEALAEEDKLSEEDLTAVKLLLVANTLVEVEAGNEVPTDDTTTVDGKFMAYSIEVTENAAKALDNVKTKVFTALTNAKSTYFKTDIAYSESNSATKWAFETEKAGSVYVDETGDAPVDGKVENKKGTYTASVYMLKTPSHRDEMISKNISYMTFSASDAALKAVSLLDAFETVDATTFASVASTSSASDTGSYENYLKGDSSYTELDEWLFDEETTKGSYTKIPLVISESEDSKTYAIFFYEDDSDAAWYLEAKSAIYGADADAKYAELLETYPVTVNEKVTNKISN